MQVKVVHSGGIDFGDVDGFKIFELALFGGLGCPDPVKGKLDQHGNEGHGQGLQNGLQDLVCVHASLHLRDPGLIVLRFDPIVPQGM